MRNPSSKHTNFLSPNVIDNLEGIALLLEANINALKESGRMMQADASDELSAFARQIYAARRVRERHLPLNFFGEPAFDMLLAAFIARSEGLTLNVARLQDASAVPITTALRWIKSLENHELVIRNRSVNDVRQILVQLTDYGYEELKKSLLAMKATLSVSTPNQGGYNKEITI